MTAANTESVMEGVPGSESVEASSSPVTANAQPSPDQNPGRSWPFRLVDGIAGLLQKLFGLVSVLVALSFLAAVPVVQFLSLGYLLEVSGRVARTGRLRNGFVGLTRAAQAGSMALGTWLMLWPVRLLSDFWYSARLLAPQGQPTAVMRFLLLLGVVLFLGNLVLALLAGGKLRHFFWPLLAPPFFAMWMLRRGIASQKLRPILRPVVGTISPRLLVDLTTVPALSDWFPPAIFLANWRRGGLWGRARDAVWDAVTSFRLPYYFSLGLRGFLGGVLWLAIPALLMIVVTKVPVAVIELGGGDRALRAFTVLASLAGLLGAFSMAFVLQILPFLQAHFAAENRFSAFWEVGRIWSDFLKAPVAYWQGLLVTILFSLPLFLLKIEYTMEELLWLPSFGFALFTFPARLLTGWVLARARKRARRRHAVSIVFGLIASLPVALFYVVVLFFTQYVSWSGAWSLLEQPPFLLPAPFLLGL